MKHATILWDGEHLPEELEHLPPGRYRIELVDDGSLVPSRLLKKARKRAPEGPRKVARGASPGFGVGFRGPAPEGRRERRVFQRPASPSEDRGIIEAIRQLDAGEGVPIDRALQEIRRPVPGGYPGNSSSE